jgi:hypothetical protein
MQYIADLRSEREWSDLHFLAHHAVRRRETHSTLSGKPTPWRTPRPSPELSLQVGNQGIRAFKPAALAAPNCLASKVRNIFTLRLIADATWKRSSERTPTVVVCRALSPSALSITSVQSMTVSDKEPPAMSASICSSAPLASVGGQFSRQTEKRTALRSSYRCHGVKIRLSRCRLR